MFTTQTNEVFQVETEFNSPETEISEDELVKKYQLAECLKWIVDNNYEKTCLQFPEELLNDGTSVALYMQKKLNKTVYILGDTCYGSCCVDEVAAQHVKADSIIHFGHACLSPVEQLPVFYVFLNEKFDVDNLYTKLQCFEKEKQVLLFYDDIFSHLYSELLSAFKNSQNIHVSKLNTRHETFDEGDQFQVLCGRIFPKFSETNISAVYLGNESITLVNLMLHLPGFEWYHYKSNDDLLTRCQFNTNKFLMKRIALVEKIKEASTIGILIGTLGIRNYLDAIKRIKLLVRNNGKRCYKLAVGKPNVAKLANFPEIDVFVYISCQENTLLKDFKGYYKPIVSLIEVEMALGDRPYSLEYTSDFRELLLGGSLYRELSAANVLTDLSNLRSESKELMERNAGTLVESSGAEFLQSRTWQGLEQRIGETEVSQAVKGRSGIAQSYVNELSTLSEEND
ncbi:hypothetical protein RUM44_009290 [Polyplax serrata]|uniref:2-(3-amino-3-carboxypropyl)histidine synthase subunit 2 n=1 Tax=Polyplax serrata TaxID=468196 RepID=A0ABR1ATS7_POLSC